MKGYFIKPNKRNTKSVKLGELEIFLRKHEKLLEIKKSKNDVNSFNTYNVYTVNKEFIPEYSYDIFC